MNRLMKSLVAGVVLIGACSVALAQPAPGGRGGGGRGPGGGPPMRMGMQGQFGMNALDDVVIVVADLNMKPGFTLSEDQKTRIQAIRDALKAAQEKWRADNADELKDVQEAMASLREQGPGGDPEAWRDVMEQNMSLMQTAPNGNDEAEQLRALLSADQAKALDARQEELAAEREKMWQQMGGGRGPGNGQGGPGGGQRGQGRQGGQGNAPGGGRGGV